MAKGWGQASYPYRTFPPPHPPLLVRLSESGLRGQIKRNPSPSPFPFQKDLALGWLESMTDHATSFVSLLTMLLT